MLSDRIEVQFDFHTEEAAREIDQLYLPSWVDMYEVIPDFEDVQVVSVSAPRRALNEQWLITEHDSQEGALVVFTQLGIGEKVRPESEILMTVRMPARLMRHINVVVCGY